MVNFISVLQDEYDMNNNDPWNTCYRLLLAAQMIENYLYLVVIQIYNTWFQ